MRNLRYTLRFLAAHKSFTAAAVFTLAIGLGANTALFGLMNVVVRPLDVPHAEQLVAIAAETRGDESGGFQFIVLARGALRPAAARDVLLTRLRRDAAHRRPVR